MKARATEIHMEPVKDGLKISYRIDGGLRTIDTFPSAIMSLVIETFKDLADLPYNNEDDPFEVFHPRIDQIGVMRLELGGQRVTLLMKVAPNEYGDKLIIAKADGHDAQNLAQRAGPVRH